VTAQPATTILVVDDDPHFRDLYQAALRIRGFNVTTASNGLAALHSIERQRPSLVILDLNMPCVDGWGVLQELGSNDDTKAIPVIVVTGEDVQRATIQAAAILRKPVLPDQVLPVINRCLRVA
jgi:CheY-like chemotaxis protein